MNHQQRVEANASAMAAIQAGGCSARYILETYFPEYGRRNSTLSTIISAMIKSKGIAPAPTELTRQTENVIPPTKQCKTLDSWSVDGVSEANTLEDTIALYQIDLDKWEIVKWECRDWGMGYKGADGLPGSKQLYRHAVVMKPRVAPLAEIRLNQLIEKAKTFVPKYVPVAYNFIKQRDCALEVSIPDIHFGKLAWSPETGGGNYDLKEAIKRYTDAIASIMASVDTDRLEEIVYVIGNDVLNSDNRAGTTEGGTAQDNDSRYHKVYAAAFDTLVCSVDTLRQVAPVKIISVPGNHDRLSAWHIARELDLWYKGAPQVSVDAEPSAFKLWEFGANMVGLIHGDGGKRAKFPLDMASEWPEVWGRTRFREVHTAHLHTMRVEEFNGVRVRILPSLCEPDAWHSLNRFTGNLPAAESFVWHKEKGLIQQHHFTVKN